MSPPDARRLEDIAANVDMLRALIEIIASSGCADARENDALWGIGLLAEYVADKIRNFDRPAR